MKKLLPYFRPYIFWFIVLLALVWGQTTATLSLPDLMADIINKGIVTGDTGYIAQTGLWMLLVTLGGGVCTRFGTGA